MIIDHKVLPIGLLFSGLVISSCKKATLDGTTVRDLNDIQFICCPGMNDCRPGCYWCWKVCLSRVSCKLAIKFIVQVPLALANSVTGTDLEMPQASHCSPRPVASEMYA